MNLLITGIHGFVGSNLVAALANTHTIYGLDIVQSEKDGVVKTYSWDELVQIPPIDAVIHLAGKAHDTKNQSAAQLYFDINLGLTQTIYDWFLLSSASRFIFFSSVKAAADIVEGVLTEEIVPSPKGPYGESKIAAENYILDRLPQNKRIIILRPCMIHGPGNKGNLNLLYSVIKRGIPWPLGAYENRRSFVSIDNLSYAIGLMLERNIASGVYHLADDETLSTNELIETICEAMGKRAVIWYIPRTWIHRLAVISSKLHLPLTKERLGKLTENYIVSNSKIKQALAINQMPVRAKEGFIRTIRSFLN